MRSAQPVELLFESAMRRVALVVGAAHENAPSRRALAALSGDELALEGRSMFLKLKKREMENR